MMPGLLYVPPNKSFMESPAFQMLSNLMMQKIAHKQRMEMVDRQIKSAEAIEKAEIEREKLEKEQNIEREQKKEVRGFKEKHWTLTPEGKKPDIMVGSVGLSRPAPPVFQETTVSVAGKKYKILKDQYGNMKTLGGPSPPQPTPGFAVETPEGTKVQYGTNIPASQKTLNKESESLRLSENSLYDLVDVTSKIQKDVGSDPSKIGTLGWMTRKVDSISSQLEAFVGKLSPEQRKKIPVDINKYDWSSLGGDAAKSSAIKSRIVKLAYMVARIREPDARQFSDADIQRAIDEVGGSTGSVEQLNANIDAILMDAIRATNIRHRNSFKKDYLPSGLDQETLDAYLSKGIPYEKIILEHMRKYGR